MSDYDFDDEMAADKSEFEVKELEQKIERLKTERDQLAASNARLAYHLEGYLESIDLINQEMIDSNGCPTAVSTKEGYDVIYSSPQQSLAEIQARAVECFAQEIGVFDRTYDDQEYVEIPRHKIREYIESIRRDGQEKTK